MNNKNISQIMNEVSELIKLGRLQDALDTCERYYSTGKSDTSLLQVMAEICTRLGNTAKAESYYMELLKIKPKAISAHVNLGMLLFKQGRIPEALEHYRYAVDISPSNPVFYFNLGVALQASDDVKGAKQAYFTALEQRHDYAKAHANLAYLLRKERKLDEAVLHYNHAIESEPEIEELHYNLGITMLLHGRVKEAEACHQKALQLNPCYSDGHTGLGAVYTYMGEYWKAINCYRNALRYNPRHVEALAGLTGVLAETGQYKEASTTIEQARHISPDNIEVAITRGYLLISNGKPREAAETGMQILKKHPENREACLLAATALEIDGEYRKAYRYLAPMLEEDCTDAKAGIVFATLSKHLGKQTYAIKLLEQLLQTSRQLPLHLRRKMHFTLGRSYDSISEYNNAFMHYTTGNKLKHARYDRRQHSTYIGKLIEFYSRDFLNRFGHSEIQSNAPIFIVGMPRSGTSLVEQIISSHSCVYGAGELTYIADMVNGMDKHTATGSTYPDCLKYLDATAINSLACGYLELLHGLSEGEQRITDKMPSNYMHLGLIEILFPQASVIHCIRDPRDLCLSCYFQDFGPSHPYAYSLADLGYHYRQYERIMNHWLKILSIPVVTIKYEELIHNQKAVTMKLLEFCNLEWDDNCLRFHDNKRLAWTASYEQVRNKLYRHSIARWQNYVQHLGELERALEGS